MFCCCSPCCCCRFTAAAAITLLPLPSSMSMRALEAVHLQAKRFPSQSCSPGCCGFCSSPKPLNEHPWACHITPGQLCSRGEGMHLRLSCRVGHSWVDTEQACGCFVFNSLALRLGKAGRGRDAHILCMHAMKGWPPLAATGLLEKRGQTACATHTFSHLATSTCAEVLSSAVPFVVTHPPWPSTPFCLPRTDGVPPIPCSRRADRQRRD